MERKQNLKDPKQGASGGGASKAAGARKQSGGESATPGQDQAAGTTPNQGASMNQGTTPSQGGSMNQGTTGQNAGDQDLLQRAKQAGGEIVNQVQERAGSQIAQQKESAATDLTQVVQAVRKFGESLAGEQGGPIARYAAEYGDKAADSLERFSTYIREQDPKQLLNDVQNFGRRQPALLLGGAFLLGFAGARLIKSSMGSGSQQGYDADVRRITSNSNINTPTSAPRPSTPGVSGTGPSTSPNAL